MKRATITEAKNGLSAVLEQVRKGETVLILDRGQAVARLEPVVPSDDPEGWTSRLQRSGIVRIAERKLPRSFLDTPPSSPRRGTTALAVLLEERNEGR